MKVSEVDSRAEVFEILVSSKADALQAFGLLGFITLSASFANNVMRALGASGDSIRFTDTGRHELKGSSFRNLGRLVLSGGSFHLGDDGPVVLVRRK